MPKLLNYEGLCIGGYANGIRCVSVQRKLYVRTPPALEPVIFDTYSKKA